jgi:phosphate transport system permease protein
MQAVHVETQQAASQFSAAGLPLPLRMTAWAPRRNYCSSCLARCAKALGATRSRAVFTVVLPSALPGIITGIVLALARIAGETAPLLFTSFNNRFFTTSLTQPIASLTVQVFTYAISPYKDWHRQAWAGALVLVTIVFLCSLLARFATRRLESIQSM